MKKNLIMVLLVVFMFTVVGCSSKKEEVDTTDAVVATETTEEATAEETVTEEAVSEVVEEVATDSETHSIGFVMIGMGNEFFESLQKEFAARFTGMGWEVDVANGEFNPQTQITAMENFIAMKKEVIVLWAVSPEPLNTVAKQAMDAGIKVVAFVQPLENYDACLLVDNEEFAQAQAFMAAAWVDKNYPDAADKSVPVVLITRDNVDETKKQGDVLRKIEEYSPKIKLVSVFDNNEEAVEAGVNAAETIYTMNPEAKVFLTVNSAVALGVNNYFTAMSSPVTEYADMAIFTLNGGGEIIEQIMKSKENAAPLRGTVMTGGVEMTIDDCVLAVNGVLDGSLKDKHNIYAASLFVFDETIDEFLKTGNVTSVTIDSFKK